MSCRRPGALSHGALAPARARQSGHAMHANGSAAVRAGLGVWRTRRARRRVRAAVPSILAILMAAACSPEVSPPKSAPGADRYLKPDSEFIQSRIPHDATLATLLKDNGLRADRIQPTLDLISKAFDPRKLKTDRPYRLIRTFDGGLRGFECEVDDDRYLRVAPRSAIAPEELAAELVDYRKQQAVAALSGSIDKETTSLFAAMQAAGETDELSIGLAAVFSGEIDFNSELQPGDAFRLAVDKTTRETGTVAYGAIQVAEFRNDGRTLRAFRFQLPDGQYGYYDDNGRSLKRFFLKSPLKFEPRITSGFSYSRLHPILNVRRAHLGVDYAAPIGAAVNAISHGVVVMAGMNGGAGRMVAVRHSGGYESVYMHLSSIAVRVGQRVSQGELIGRVGSSGLSTGPHLDYRLKKNGVYVNPLLEHKRMPPGDPIPASLLDSFKAQRDRLAALLPPSGPGHAAAAAAQPQPSGGPAPSR